MASRVIEMPATWAFCMRMVRRLNAQSEKPTAETVTIDELTAISFEMAQWAAGNGRRLWCRPQGYDGICYVEPQPYARRPVAIPGLMVHGVALYPEEQIFP